MDTSLGALALVQSHLDYRLITASSGFLYMNASESECISSGTSKNLKEPEVFINQLVKTQWL
jgi:hypothetical protein